MTLTILLLAIVVTVIGSVLLALRGSVPRHCTIEELESRLRQVDLAAFLNLTDPRETLYLSRSLPPARFRRVQRLRIAAALNYLSAVSRNAAILLRIGDLASQSEDQEISRSGRELSNTALRTRILALRTYLRLIPEWLFPSARPLRPDLVPHYDELKRCLVHLVSMQQPAMTSRVASLL